VKLFQIVKLGQWRETNIRNLLTSEHYDPLDLYVPWIDSKDLDSAFFAMRVENFLALFDVLAANIFRPKVEFGICEDLSEGSFFSDAWYLLLLLR
jgi:hypothetical protein